MKGAISAKQVAEFRRAFDGEIDSLAALYRQATADMMEVVADAAKTASQRRHAVALLRQYQKQLAALQDEAALWVEVNIPRSYRIGLEFADAGAQRIRRAGIQLQRRSSEVFAQVHTQAVEAIMESILGPFEAMTTQIGRRVDDLFRRVGTQEAAKGLVEGKTRLEVSKAIEERLLAEGRPYFTDALGRRWQLDQYAEMVARTTTREAATQGTINRLREHGITLAQVTAHNAADFCIYYENVIVCVDGQSPVYPSLDAINGGPPFHPNCHHGLTSFVEELSSPEEIEAGKVTDSTVLNATPKDLQRKFRREFPERAKAEAKRLSEQAAKHRSLRVKREERATKRAERTAARRPVPEVQSAKEVMDRLRREADEERIRFQEAIGRGEGRRKAA